MCRRRHLGHVSLGNVGLYKVKHIIGLLNSFTNVYCNYHAGLVFVSQGYHNKVPTIGWLKITNISHSSGGQKSVIRVLTGPILSLAAQQKDPFWLFLASGVHGQCFMFLGLWTRHHSSHMTIFLCIFTSSSLVHICL